MIAYDLRPGFTIGCDPELIVIDPTGKPVCADGLLPGTKDKPYSLVGGAVQVDGFAAEFNIKPANTFVHFWTRCRNVQDSIKQMLPPGYDLLCAPSTEFSHDVFEAAPARAKELGCMPDFNAWTNNVNTPPRPPEDMPTLRTMAGHIHIGWTDDASLEDEEHLNNCNDLVKQLDWYLGAWSITQDPDTTRRRLYGQAGACRYKPYGVEYRVLSNFWLKDMDTCLGMWNRLVKAIDAMATVFLPDAFSSYNDRLIEAIKTSHLDDDFKSMFQYPIGMI